MPHRIGVGTDPTHAEDGDIFWFEYMERSAIAFLSLEMMLRTIFAACGSSLIYMGADGQIDCDYKAFWDIARRMNPGIKFWESG